MTDTTEFCLEDLLVKNSYKVPVYQRNYDWGEAQIQQLVDDIKDYSDKPNSTSEKSDTPSYYIGSLVVHQKADYFEILDGQQRFTTITLLVCYLKYRLPDEFKWYSCTNLGFESRPKSEDTIKKIFEIISSNKTMPFTSSEALSGLISSIYTEEFSQSISDGFKAIDRIMSRTFPVKEGNEAIKTFASYLVKNVKILRICVPKNTDVSHYFEVMNNRGEQLERHEIVKANLLSVVQENQKEMAVIQKIWLACADMNRYVQTGFSVEERKKIFGDTCEGFVSENFDKVLEYITVGDDNLGENAIDGHFFTLDQSIELGKKLQQKKDDKNQKINSDDEGKEERFTSGIDFSNFLMQVLRIYVKQESNENLPALDDKELIAAFKTHIGKNAIKVKEFVFALLKMRYLFDCYIVKRERVSGREGWSLKHYKFDKNGSDYVNSFGKEDGEDIYMLLSAFEVSYPGNSRKNWLSAVLYWLNNNNGNITAKGYLIFLERLAKSFMLNRYLVEVPKEYSSFIYTVVSDEMPEVSFEKNHHLLRYGQVRIFAFNFLDYVLWKTYQLDPLKKSRFRFSSKYSVEHFSPQTPKANERPKDDMLHGFGNLCLMASTDNSSLSNDGPQQKADILNQRRAQMAPFSLKLELMLEKSKLWGPLKEDAEKVIWGHEKEMLEVMTDFYKNDSQ